MPEAICLDIVKHGFFEDLSVQSGRKTIKQNSSNCASGSADEGAEQKSQWMTIKINPLNV
jgi:hypothetical protein